AATRYKLDDFKPYIFKTTDYGKSWRAITGGIPDNHFIRVVREDPTRRGLLYAGGEFGIYVSFDDGANWQSLQRNLPVVPIHDLVVKDNDLVAATHGRAFWILDDLTPLQQLSDSAARATRYVYTPRTAYRMGLGGGFGGGGGGFPGVGRNPPGGAVVFFYLKDAPDSATNMSLDFLDSRDSLGRRLTPRPRAPSPDSLKVRAGMNRFVWNLRYADASRFQGMIFWAGGTAGPVAVPGNYKVRLTVGDWSQTRVFEVRGDPRVKTTPAEYQQQFDLLTKIRDRVSAANDAVRRIREVRDQIDGAATRARGLGDAGKRIGQQADSIKGRLGAIEQAIYQVQNRASQDPLNYPIRLNNKIA